MEREVGEQRAEPQAESVAEPPSRAVPRGGARISPRLTADTARALQRAAGNRAVSTLVSRDPAPSAPPAPTPPELSWNPFGWVFSFLPQPAFNMRPPAPVMPTDVVEVAVIELWSALQPLAGDPRLAALWGAVASQVVRPQTTKPKRGVGKDLPDAVFAPTVVKALLALGPAGTKEEKAQRAGKESAVLQRVFALAGSARDKQLPAAANPPAQTLDAEWNSLGDLQKFFAGKEGYLAARPSILLAFGALDVATSRAVDRLRRFFGEMVQQEFCGTVYTVHPVMASKLRRAADKLGPNPPQVEGVPLQQVRASHNDPLSLSKHSFGLAIDLRATHNPNIQNYGSYNRLIQIVTGIDTTVGTRGTKREGGNLMWPESGGTPRHLTTDEALVEATRLRKASDDFKAAFADDAAFTATLGRVARSQARAQGANDAELRVAAEAAWAEGANVEWSHRVGEQVHSYPTLKPKAGKLKPGPAHEALARLLFPETFDPAKVPAEAAYVDYGNQIAMNVRVREAVDLLIELVGVYKGSFDKKGRRVRPTHAEPTPSQIAAHGFFDLPPAVVAALTGSDGGDLRWLGGLQGNLKDYMHFEVSGDPIKVLNLRADRNPPPANVQTPAT